MDTLSNALLKLNINPIGAELSNITSQKNDTTFMWDGNPDIWSGIAPNLFPIVGALKNGEYIYNSKTYKLEKHGFLRHNSDFKLIKKTKNSLCYSLSDSEKTRQHYPFAFQFKIFFTLNKNIVTVSHSIINTDNKTLYFSLGGHPAFKCPVYPNETYSDYLLRFNHVETANSHLVDLSSGLIKNETLPILNNETDLQLNPEIFNQDALIFKHLKSKKIALISKTKGRILEVEFSDFNYLGLWAKPHAPYICIEPWLGIADPVNSNKILQHKEAIIALNTKQTYNASYSIEIDQQHLV